jgi:hypothetical protein
MLLKLLLKMVMMSKDNKFSIDTYCSNFWY